MNHTSLLCVFAHPDDEFAVAGLIAKARAQHIPVNLVCVTKGEAGTIRNKQVKLLAYKSVAEIRCDEYIASNEALNTSGYYFLGELDGQSKGWDKDRLVNQLQEIISKTQSTHLVTLKNNAMNRHPDHIAVTEVAHQCYGLSRDLELIEFTLFTEDFLNRRFWFLSKKIKKRLFEKVSVQEEEVSGIYRLSSKEMKKKLFLLKIYKSQFPDEQKRYYKQPLWLLKYICRHEAYYDSSGKGLEALGIGGIYD